MKENRYDDAGFFAKYSQMERSQKGLEGAGEWETLRDMLPDFGGKRVLDLGCGYGWHCRYAVQQGATEVLGIDLSERMLSVAREKGEDPRIRYQRSAAEDLQLAPASFDVVISSLMLHYLEDVPVLFARVYDWLRPGGVLVFSAEHPIFTAAGSQDWVYRPDGSIDHFPVDHYFYEGRREACFLGEPVIKYHHTLTTYLRGLLRAGFIVTDLAEPQPPERMRESVPGMQDEMRRPMMLIVCAQKPRGSAII